MFVGLHNLCIIPYFLITSPHISIISEPNEAYKLEFYNFIIDISTVNSITSFKKRSKCLPEGNYNTLRLEIFPIQRLCDGNLGMNRAFPVLGIRFFRL